MELISNRCTQCMGEVVPMDDGIHAKCPYCGSVYLLPQEGRAAASQDEQYDDEDYTDGTFDLEEIIARVMGAPEVYATSTLWGDNVSEKEDAARKFFGIPRDDDVYLILDTTIFGSCKVGLAITTTGLCMKDEDGAARVIDWDEFVSDVTFSYDDGTLEIDGSKFFSTDGDYIFDILELVRQDCLDSAEGGELDIVGIIEDVLNDDDVMATSTLWGDDVARKEDAARKFFGIPRDDDVYLILDTTIFGSCKVGLAITTTGLCMKDEDGAARVIDWDEFEDVRFTYDDGTLEIDGSQFFSTDGDYIFDILDQAYQSLYG